MGDNTVWEIVIIGVLIAIVLAASRIPGAARRLFGGKPEAPVPEKLPEGPDGS